MRTFTWQDVVAWKPCRDYPPERVQALLGHRNDWTPLAWVEELDGKIPARDIRWLCLRPDVCDERTLRWFAIRCAERALRGPDRVLDPRAGRAVEVAQRYVDGLVDAAALVTAYQAAEQAAVAASVGTSRRSPSVMAISAARWAAAADPLQAAVCGALAAEAASAEPVTPEIASELRLLLKGKDPTPRDFAVWVANQMPVVRELRCQLADLRELLQAEEVAGAASRAMLRLSSADRAGLIQPLRELGDFAAELQALDTEGVAPLARGVETSNVFRDDERGPALPREDALANAPERTDAAFRTPAPPLDSEPPTPQ